MKLEKFEAPEAELIEYYVDDILTKSSDDNDIASEIEDGGEDYL
jgi:hypothetical protein